MQKHNYLEIAEDMIFDGVDKDEVERNVKSKVLLSDEEKIALTSQINDIHVSYEFWKQERSNNIIQLALGIILFTFGLSITLITYFSNSSNFIVAFGLILGGAYLSWKKYLAIINPKDAQLKPRTKKFRGNFHKQK